NSAKEAERQCDKVDCEVKASEGKGLITKSFEAKGLGANILKEVLGH
ncbi:4712_t:CDS:2, partial [Racocetra fulgida]